MAIRSSAGSGVTISLIVFVLLTVLLIAASILLWGRYETEKKTAADATAALNRYATKAERASDWLGQLDAASGRDTILKAFNDRHTALWQFATGRGDGLGDLAASRQNLGLTNGESLAGTMSDLQRQVSDLQAANQALQARADDAEASRAKIAAELQSENDMNNALLAAESSQLQPYVDADSRHAEAIRQAVTEFDRMQASLRDQKDATIAEQQDAVDRLSADNKRLGARLRDIEARLNRDRLNAADPAALVDGRILDVVGSGDMVYINRGRNDQIVLGMTFEVYENAAQIQTEGEDGRARGKASIQVIKIGDASSTAKVTRSVKGRPILPNNVITNAIYDPSYTFKFLVHGKFDIDQDGKPSEEEADYLRDRIRRWGGKVVIGNEIPGDLDFLVLGVEPQPPVKPSTQSSTQILNEYRRIRTMVDRYKSLLSQAQQAKIPVLNQNRLDILTGRTDL
jgi:uncharacterized phage infection (PIP) family protein YhgE